MKRREKLKKTTVILMLVNESIILTYIHRHFLLFLLIGQFSSLKFLQPHTLKYDILSFSDGLYNKFLKEI